MQRSFLTRMGTLAAILALGLSALGLSACGSVPTYTVDSTLDAPDAAVNGTCATSAGDCTLRAALTEAENDAKASLVKFAIEGPGPHTIDIGASLPSFREGRTTIDGYTQDGSKKNDSARGSNAVLKIQLTAGGTGASFPDATLDVYSSANVIKGLALFNNERSIRMADDGATDNVVVGNFIGTNAAASFGHTVFNNSYIGVVMVRGASRNVIGTSARADRNVISGNAGRGVDTHDGDTVANVIQNNVIGLNPLGTAAVANLGHGVDINVNSKDNRILGNVISGNRGHGVEVSHGAGAARNEVVGNYIGTTLDGAAGPSYARNVQVNVRVEDHAADTLVADNVIGNNLQGGIKVNNLVTQTEIRSNSIGISTTGAAIGNGPYGIRIEDGTTEAEVGPDNEIANNAVGIQIFNSPTLSSRLNTITHNSIHDNTGLGIDLDPLGSVNQNDGGDPDSGGNDRLNFPVLATTTSSSVTGTACAGCTVEVFVADSTATNPAQQGSYGEGETFLAAGAANGAGAFTIPLPPEAAGTVITSTATDPPGNTSEFSLNKQVPA